MAETKKIVTKRAAKKKAGDNLLKKPRAKTRKVVDTTPEPVVGEVITPAAREYLYGLGRRKEAIAQVRVYRKGSGKITVNERDYTNYFPRFDLQETVRGPLVTVGQAEAVDVAAKVYGGGSRGQADAVQLGLARALLKQNDTFRVGLKRQGFLHRDPRVKERKKYGLKKARRAPQWAKR